MKKNIRDRVKEIEHSRKKNILPDVVLIYWDYANKHWIAREQYTKKNSQGNTIKGSGTVKTIVLSNPDEYIPKKGFKGSIIQGVIEE